MVEYHVKMTPKFQDILDESYEKVNFGGWLSVSMNLIEHPVIVLGKNEAILKQYLQQEDVESIR